MLAPLVKGYRFDKLKYENVNPGIESAVFRASVPRTKCGPWRHPVWVFDYTIEGGSFCKVGSEDNEWLLRKPGTGHLYPPFIRYWEDSEKTSGKSSSMFITFTGGGEAGLDRFIENSMGFAQFSDSSGAVKKHLRKMVEAAQYGDRAYWTVQSVFAGFLQFLNTKTKLRKDYLWDAGGDAQDEDPSIYDKSILFFNKNYNNKISMKELAKHLNVSLSTLTHRYKKDAGESPLETLMRIRIENAKELMRNGQSIKEISALVGFYDEFHFMKTFKRITGLTVRQYRKMLES